VRESVSKFIARMDGVAEPRIDDIFLTEGASQGVHLLLSTLIVDKNDAIMIPIPQYPLYTASISLNGGVPAPYLLNESKGWQLDIEELERSYQESVKQGKNIKAIVVINPGNPTGSILSTDTIAKIIEFSVRNRIVVIADEVYRENVYKEGTSFVSFRKVLETLGKEVRENCELASLHSVSKGLLGECGLRGGYLYLHNFNPLVVDQLVKLKSINLCSNSIGQMMVELMVNPPTEGVSQ
jgi:aspartate/methionine/tyrosine aminotransferase